MKIWIDSREANARVSPPICKQSVEIFDSTAIFKQPPFLSKPLNWQQGKLNDAKGAEEKFDSIISRPSFVSSPG